MGVAPLCLLPVEHGYDRALPPSSLRPEVESKEIQISHARRTVRACAFDEKTAECAAQQEEIDAATRLFLRRDGEPRSTSDDVVKVDIPHGNSRQIQVVRVKRGEWIVDWPRSNVHRVSVTATQTAAIKLTTVLGQCEVRQRKCVLVSRAETRRIQILDAAIPAQ